MKDQPPSIQDGPFGLSEPSNSSQWTGISSNSDAADTMPQGKKLTPGEGFKIARAAFESSTNWLNAGRRAAWADSLRAFQSRHAQGSKYTSREFAFRSNLYMPKTRATVRKNEAHTATAFFANEDVVSIKPVNDDDPKQLASADALKAILNYRLKHSVPWFLTVVGARQDAEVMGICVSRADWLYKERKVGSELRPVMDDNGHVVLDKDGFAKVEEYDVMEIVEDRPRVDLISPENIRFEPGCDWRDPVKTSPYFIELMPMYINDVKERIESGEWHDIPDSSLRSASDIEDDTTRRSREQDRVPGKDKDAWKPQGFEICWVRNNIIKYGGRDWQFYTLGSAGELLSDPQPLEKVYLHGQRPYVVGCIVLETHKTYPAGKPELTRDLQRAANDDWNLRFDVLKLQLNPRLFIKTGSGVDPQDARTFAPGKIVLMKGNPSESVAWERPPTPGAEVYQESDRINLAWDDLVGDFTNSSVQSSQVEQQSATGMNLMSGEASGTKEYELRMFAETWAEPMFRLLIKLIQAYETDETILAMAGANAQLFQRFGIDKVTDDLLQAELTVQANVGIGATNPMHRLKNFLTGADAIGKMFGPQIVSSGVDFNEVLKEIFGMLGYRDGMRFLKKGFDPQVEQLKQELAKLQNKGGQGAAPQPPDQSRVQAAQVQGQFRLQERQIEAQQEDKDNASELQIAALKAQTDLQRQRMKQQHDMAELQINQQHDATKQAIDQQHQAGMAGMQHNLAMFAQAAAPKPTHAAPNRTQ